MKNLKLFDMKVTHDKDSNKITISGSDNIILSDNNKNNAGFEIIGEHFIDMHYSDFTIIGYDKQPIISLARHLGCSKLKIWILRLMF